ncbi:type II secretion system F family protein [Candidatus Saccharibacteria bacterium]|jgi:type IV pilus assembly protein PilC|nr:type II secretion system F family protein [Candidatus Saccharibacteria bacterium]
MLFTYKALRKDNSPVSGTIEAGDRDAAMAALSHQGLHPLVVTATGAKRSFGFGKSVKTSDMVIFTRQLSTMISAGVPIARGLVTLQDSATAPYFREVLGKISKDVEGGTQLGDAFAKYPNVFDDIYVNMVRAGEEGGILDDILKRLAIQVEQNASIKKKVKGAMSYPTVILSITVVAFFGIMFVLMPKIAKILSDLGGPNAKLPIYTQILLDVSHFSRKYAFIIIPGMFLAVWLVRRYIKTPKGKYQFHTLLLRLPIVKTIVTKVAIARFSRTFASLMSAGVGVLDSLAVTGGAIGNKVIEKELAAAAVEVKNGKQLSEVIAESKHFPKIVSQMLAVGEETGTTDTVLLKVADFYEEEVSTAIDSLASVIEPVMILFLGSGVGLIAASVMGPIASLSSSIGNN